MAIGTGTAIIGGSLIAGALGAKSDRDAAKQQGRGIDAGIAEQRRQFDVTQEQAAPFREAGLRALERQQILLGLRGTEAQQQGFNVLADSPGQKFLRDRAQRNLVRSAAAIGGLGGGNVRSALIQQGVGFAQQDLQNEIARLGQLAGQGQAITTNVAQLGAQTAGNIQRGLQAGGAARASGVLGQNQAIQQAISGVTTGLTAGGGFGSTQAPVAPINPFAVNQQPAVGPF